MATKYILKLEFGDFLIKVIPIHIMELMAALVGTYYLRKIPSLKSTKYLVYFLWLTVFVEIVCSYPAIAYFSEYRYFAFVKDTPFNNNYWLYNIYIIISYLFYIYYFRSFLKSKILKSLFKYLMFIYFVLSVGYFFIEDIYFQGISEFESITGTLLLVFVVVSFYFELLKSDVLLKLKHFLPLYISVGVLIFHLCTTPIDMFSEYFKRENQFYVQLQANVYLFANIFLYSTYILGFIVCSRKKRSY